MRFNTRIRTSSIPSLSVAMLVALGCSKNEPPPAAPASDYEYTQPGDDSAMQPASRELAPGEAAAAARGPSSQSPEPASAEPMQPVMEPLDDAKIAAITDAANSGEVEQARIALNKAKNARVRKFAQMMIQHHGQAKKDDAKLVNKLKVTPVESNTSGQLREESTTLVSTLQAADKSNFDSLYIKSQVEVHQRVLDLFDKQLIPNAKDAALLASLQAFRPKIEAHLTEAREIQKVLDSEAGANRAGATQQSDVAGKQQPGAAPADATRAGAAHDHGQMTGAGR